MADSTIARPSRATPPFYGTWLEAKAAGALRYIDGAICRRGHSPTIRITSNRQCAGCRDIKQQEWLKIHFRQRAARQAEWAEKNREKRKAQNAAWVAANYEKHIANCTRWRKANPERVAKLIAAWGKAHPENRPAVDAKRRAAKVGADGSFTGRDVIDLYDRQRGICVYCPVKLGDDYHVDHIMPLALGGSNGPRNIQLLCERCNLKKGATHPAVFVRRLRSERVNSGH